MKKRDAGYEQLNVFEVDYEHEPKGKYSCRQELDAKACEIKYLERSSKLFVPFKEDELKGFHIPGSDNTGSLCFMTGLISNVEFNGDSITLTLKALRSDEKVTFNVNKDDGFYDKVIHACTEDKASIAMVNDKCVDFKYGPFFGAIHWRLVNNEETAEIKCSIKK